MTTVLLLCGCGQLVRATSDFAFNQPWNDYRRIEVQVRNGSVELRATDVTDVRVSGRKSVGGATFAEAEENLGKVTVEAVARADHPDTLRIEVNYPDELRSKSVGTDLVIQIPQPCAANVHTTNGRIQIECMAGEVELGTTNGRITARDITGTLHAKSSNGRIEVEAVDGSLVASTSNGRITAKGVKGPCTLGTSNGGIQAEEIEGDVKAETSNGNIRLAAVPPAGGKIDLRSSNGGIHATLPENLAAEYQLSTTNGRIHVSLGKAVMKMIDSSRRRFHAIVNEGGGTVSAQTTNGSITVESR
jgi:DUF4097 and DUF4098 domain-containing protein YvlB